MVKLTEQQKAELHEWSHELDVIYKQLYRRRRRLWRLFDEVPNSRVTWITIVKLGDAKTPSVPKQPHPRCGKMSLEEAEYVGCVNCLEKAKREIAQMNRNLEDLFTSIPTALNAWNELKMDERMIKEQKEQEKQKKRKIIDNWFDKVMKPKVT